MEEHLYHVFQVYDYKGGELRSDINMKYDDFVSFLSSHYEGVLGDIEILADDSLIAVIEKLEKVIEEGAFDNDGSYAGCDDGDIIEMYYTSQTNPGLHPVDVSDVVVGLAKLEHKYYLEDQNNENI